MQMKRFGATISEEEEEVVHIPSPYKVKPRSKNFFCFPPFAFIGVRSWCFFFIQNFLFWFVRLSFSIRHEENKTPFSIVRRMGGGSPRGRHETLPMPCLSLLFSPFFLFPPYYYYIERYIYKVFTLFLFFVFPWATFWTFNSSALIRSSWKNVRWLFDLLHLCWNWSLSCEASSQGPAGLRVTHIVRRAVHPSSAVELLQWLLIL